MQCCKNPSNDDFGDDVFKKMTMMTVLMISMVFCFRDDDDNNYCDGIDSGDDDMKVIVHV